MDMARGGIHQRLAAAALQEESNSAVAEYLLNEFAWGRMSPQQMQSIAALAMQDVEKAVEGKLLRDLKFLPKIGNEGRYPNNMYRDLMRMVDSRYNLCPMTTLEIPSKMGETMANLLMPHELFLHSCMQNTLTNFTKLFCQGAKKTCNVFGNNARTHLH